MNKENKRVVKRELSRLFAVLVLVIFLNLPLVSALQFSNIRAEEVTQNTANIRWETDNPADSFVYYGPDPQNLLPRGDASLVTEHEMALSGLNTGTEYSYYVQSNQEQEDNSGNLYTFTTLGPDKQAPTIEIELPEFVQGDEIDIIGQTEIDAEVKLSLNDRFISSRTAEQLEANHTFGTFAFERVALTDNQLNSIKLEAVDAAGNSGSWQGNVFADTHRPQLELEEVAEVVDKNSIKLKGTISENVSIEIFVGNRSVKKLEGISIDEEIRLNEGMNKIKIVLADQVGHETIKTLEVLSDTKPPQVRFDLEKGNQYYEGRAETDINGETEAGAKVYLYVFQQGIGGRGGFEFDRAIAKTTADEEGKFTFDDVSFPPSLLNRIEAMGPREVPPGLQDILISRLDNIAQEQRKSYRVVVIAEDQTGKSGYKDTVVNVNTCFSGNFVFDISIHPDFPPMPFRLDPTLMEEGREQIMAVFEVKYRGSALGKVNPSTGEVQPGYKISGLPQFQKACTREMAETDDYTMGCRLLPSTLSAQGNPEGDAYFVSAGLHPASEFVDEDEDPWADFVDKRQLKFPLKITLRYQEREADGSWGSVKTQPFCYDLGYFVDVPVDKDHLAPDFLVDQALPALNATINAIQEIKPYVRTAAIVAGVGCVASFLGKLIVKYYRFFIGNFEPWLTKDEEEDKKCPSNIVERRKLLMKDTIEHWRDDLQANYVDDPPNSVKNFKNYLENMDEAKSLDELCPQTAGAWKAEETVDYLYKFTCDRFFCRAVPAGWTQYAEKDDVDKVVARQKSCAVTADCTPLIEKENCPDDPSMQHLQGSTCYEHPTNREIYRLDKSSEPADQDVGFWRLERASQATGPVGKKVEKTIFAYQPKGSDQFCIAQDITCRTKCGRIPGYSQAKDGYRLSYVETKKWDPNLKYSFGGQTFISGIEEGVYKLEDKDKYYDGTGREITKDGKKYIDEEGTPIEISTENRDKAAKSEAFDAWQERLKVGGGGCYRVDYNAKGELTLFNQAKKALDLNSENKLRGGHTTDCFANRADPYGDQNRYECVCEQDPKKEPVIKSREALKTDSKGTSEEYFYRQDKVYQESKGNLGTHYPKWRYYKGRDVTAAFGLDWLFDNFKKDTDFTSMSEAKVDPHNQFVTPFQTACFRGILARLTMVEQIMIGLRDCIIQAKYTGFHDAGMCKTLFTQYFCNLAYKLVSYLASDCSPLSIKDKDGPDFSDSGVKEFFDSGFKAIPDAMESSISEVKSDYGDAQVNQFFAAGAEGFSESICLFALGYDFPMGMDFIQDTVYSFSTEITPMFPIAEREMATIDPVRGNVVFNYHVAGSMWAGCKIRGYKVSLKCVGPEDAAHPDVDKSCLGKGCDCLGATSLKPEFAGDRERLIEGGSSLQGVERGTAPSFPIPSPQKVSSNYRYDHVVLDIFLDQFEDPEQCFDSGRQVQGGGRFYFPIREVQAPFQVACNVDPTSGQFLCPQVRGVFGGAQTYLEHPFVHCYDKRLDEDVNCDNPNVFVESKGDQIVIKPYVHIGEDKACLKIKDNRGLIDKTIDLTDFQPGPYSPRLVISDTIPSNLISGGSLGSITTQQDSDPGCGGNNGQVYPNKRPDSTQTGTSKKIIFKFTPRGGDNYQVIVSESLPGVKGNYQLNGNVLTLGGRDVLSKTEIDAAIFTLNGFEFSKVMGNPSPRSGTSSQCVYQITPPRAGGRAGNYGMINLRLELIKPGPTENCLTARTPMPRSNFGVPSHAIQLRVQSQLSAEVETSDMHAKFQREKYDPVIDSALGVTNQQESTLNDAVAVYYWIASLVMKGKGVVPYKIEITNLLKLFFERQYSSEVVLSPYPSEVTETAEYKKINMYLCEIARIVGYNAPQGCSTAAVSSADAACNSAHPGWSCQCELNECNAKLGSNECQKGLCTDSSVSNLYCCTK